MPKSKVQNLFLLLIAATLLVALPVLSFAQKARAQNKQQPSRTSANPRAQAEFNQVSKQADEARLSHRLEDAIALYLQALRLKSDWAEGWWYLASIFYDRDRYSEARDALRSLLSIQSQNGNGQAWALMGLCEFQLRNYDQALADIQYARTLGMGDNKEFIMVSRYHAAILLTRSGQFELGYEVLRLFAREGNESLSIIEALGANVLRMPFLPSEIPPDKRELVLLAGRAAFYQAARRVLDSQRGYQELLARYPDTPNVHYAYGVFLLVETPDAALEEFRRELKISPTHIPAMLQIAFEYIKRNDFEAAKPFAEKAVETAPTLFAARNALGSVLLELGKVDDAIRELEIGVKQAPDSPEMHFALARAYSRAGRKEDAAKERAMFLKLDKEMRSLREGPQSVGGIEAKPPEKNPPQR